MPSEIVSPRWREEVVLWAGRAPGFRAWRQHDALQSKFHPEHADDIPVFFRDAASGRDEQMWVHVIGYDRPSDEYLGILINTPDLVSSIQAGDNVAFRNVDWAEYPWALSVGGSYRQAGLPAFAPSGLLDITAQALNQYRQGNFGHNRPAIEAAITSFQRAQTMVTEETYPANRFCLHFYLARCYSEIYATTEAAEEFGRALAIFPRDEHARMGLLAELSVLAHKSKGEGSSLGFHSWVERFEEQVRIVRENFPRDADSNLFLDQVLSGDPPDLGDDPAPSAEEITLAKRIGFGPFRWKVK